jgi:hypothetical protein
MRERDSTYLNYRRLKSANGTACRQDSIRHSGGHAAPVLRVCLDSRESYSSLSISESTGKARALLYLTLILPFVRLN